jgi:cytochrome c-type biogenesis protein CcmH
MVHSGNSFKTCSTRAPVRHSIIALLCLIFCTPTLAATIEQPLNNPTHEATARRIFHELKCVVCEGQSLADSDAVLAKQIRAHVRTRVESGQSQEEILTYFRDRYGEAILMRPPVERHTALLWLAPLLLLLVGMFFVRRATKTPGGDA